MAWFLVQLTMNLTCGNLRSLSFFFQRTRKITAPLSYHSSNLSSIALETMRLLVQIQISIVRQIASTCFVLLFQSQYHFLNPYMNCRFLGIQFIFFRVLQLFGSFGSWRLNCLFNVSTQMALYLFFVSVTVKFL